MTTTITIPDAKKTSYPIPMAIGDRLNVHQPNGTTHRYRVVGQTSPTTFTAIVRVTGRVK